MTANAINNYRMRVRTAVHHSEPGTWFVHRDDDDLYADIALVYICICTSIYMYI